MYIKEKHYILCLRKAGRNMQFTVNGAAISEQEKQAYIDYVQAKAPERRIDYIKVQVDGDFADLEYRFVAVSYTHLMWSQRTSIAEIEVMAYV